MQLVSKAENSTVYEFEISMHDCIKKLEIRIAKLEATDPIRDHKKY